MVEQKVKKKGFINRSLDIIEKSGNKLPDPVVIFISLCLIILFASFVTGKMGVSAKNPADGKVIEAVNLLTPEGIAKIISEAVNNFATFPPLGLVLVVMIGVGVAEKTGYFETLMKYTIEKTPRKIIVPMIILVGILGNAAGDAAPIVLPPIAAMVFIKLGYHPVAGLVMAYASALGGYSASLMIGMSDALIVSFTEPAAKLVDDSVPVNAVMNYYFLCVSTVVLLIAAWFVTVKITIPRFGAYKSDVHTAAEDVTPTERKAMIYANIALLIAMVIVTLLAVPENGLLRNAKTGSLIQDSPLMNGIVPIITVLFFVPGLVYGFVAGTMRSTKKFAEMLGDAMSTMGPFIVIVFFAAQMLAYFKWSNLGTIIAIKGAEALQGQNGVVLILGVLALSAFINMLIGSASAKWAIMAPILVPMLMLLGFHPAFTQVIYRVGDSITNPITPMMPYLPLLLSYAQRYVKDIGLGTLIAALMPFSVAFGIFWTILLIAWYLTGLPVGPGGPIHLK
ncbi:AbgT family transporter [Macrococcoides caseolyticum]|uniref:AbgT family transporter n=1 Tax=Macrococcoides caseolyticum TaxID=69966 RepID=UPI000A291930|nr:AbgT family transporter [Macrococcus caseolyticus]ARQ03727.1 p-aminobenzoyl-glutamate transport protein [Macrococcus caseolyticus]PKE06617.1 aminobenzoyl-glutamate transporter [Macrococcus caseolyticus]PKE17044.1 aminobenzoyl-glutamate transporter [Macrococcus caseolyticus]PKE24390.1 aminobenzoyl-glutamate transporter [Macrococcus caseolyticus]PKE50176.1 aminobenzoyl-glutamate transporter [Macrococcus caseolyticus]